MPSSHQFLSEPFLYVARFSGKLRLADLIEGADFCRASPLFRAAMPQLIDLSQVTDIALDFEEVRRFLTVLRQDYSKNSQGVAMFILVTGTHNFAHVRQFEMLAADLDGLSVRIFTDPQACLAALGRPEASIESLLGAATPAKVSQTSGQAG